MLERILWYLSNAGWMHTLIVDTTINKKSDCSYERSLFILRKRDTSSRHGDTATNEGFHLFNQFGG